MGAPNLKHHLFVKKKYTMKTRLDQSVFKRLFSKKVLFQNTYEYATFLIFKYTLNPFTQLSELRIVSESKYMQL